MFPTCSWFSFLADHGIIMVVFLVVIYYFSMKVLENLFFWASYFELLWYKLVWCIECCIMCSLFSLEKVVLISWWRSSRYAIMVHQFSSPILKALPVEFHSVAYGLLMYLIRARFWGHQLERKLGAWIQTIQSSSSLKSKLTRGTRFVTNYQV